MHPPPIHPFLIRQALAVSLFSSRLPITTSPSASFKALHQNPRIVTTPGAASAPLPPCLCFVSVRSESCCGASRSFSLLHARRSCRGIDILSQPPRHLPLPLRQPRLNHSHKHRQPRSAEFLRWYHTSSTPLADMNSPSSADGGDLIGVNNLILSAVTGTDSWRRPKPQPVQISLWIKTSVGLAGSSDHLPYSINYGTVCKRVSEFVTSGEFRSLEHLAEGIARVALGKELKAEWVKIHVEKPRTLLRADAAGLSIVRRYDGKKEEQDKVYVKDLRLVTIIGVNPWERLERQNVVVNLTLHKPIREMVLDKDTLPENQPPTFNPVYDYRKVVHAVTEHVENSSYKTIEALVTAIAKVVCLDCGVESVTVRAEKPSALTFAKSSSVEITRQRQFFRRINASDDAPREAASHDAFVALGSNMGDKFGMIKSALNEMASHGIKIVRTSSLYDSAPMYVTDQDIFLNAVCQVETTLSPENLLKKLQEIEKSLGRVKTVDKGPRCIDLDILLYDALTISTPDLTIPHPLMLDREFVLRPLCDIARYSPHPHTSTTFAAHLAMLKGGETDTMLPLSPYLAALHPTNPTRPTLTMAVINLTPDSFSDGGIYDHTNVAEAVASVVARGASIVDFGGVSTRPGADIVSEEEELSRVIPAIESIRSCADEAVRNVTISVDTFRASVARAAVAAGADIINDVSGGTHDKDMLRTVAELDVPIALMHMRGTPQTMDSLATYPDGLIETVGRELEVRVQEAFDAGVKRWRIILDPGLGFAKGMEHNLEIIRRLDDLRARENLKGFPWLLGPSRKRFVGTITGVKEAHRRQWGTAGAVAACIAGGADIIRVHDVEEMKKVSAMAEAIWRR